MGDDQMIYSYNGFDIESFEAGKGLWHARIKRADQTPVVIDGVLFPTLEVGFAWSDPDAAIADAKAHVDRFRRRHAGPSPAPQLQRPTAR
jgi:hypothetical protein